LSSGLLGGRPLAAIGGRQEPAIAAVVFDERHLASRAYAEALSRLGARSFATRGDAMVLWYGELGEFLRRSGGSVSGLTDYRQFVVARSVGRELGLRPALAETRVGRLTRWMFAPRKAPEIPDA